MTAPLPPTVEAWERRGAYRTLCGWRTFTADLPATDGEDGGAPLLVLHGFPTCSFDFHLVVDALARTRRLLLLDMIGYGLSDKPDMRYTIDLQADVVQAFVADVGTPSISLLTHDLGDTVGGELLARHAEGRWDVDITERVLTNGSIYIEMAHLSDGQNFLLALPDERLPESTAIGAQGVAAGLAATFSPRSTVDDAELSAAARLVTHHDGHLVLPRTIRYIEERRKNQARYTGAIESHRAPLAVIWGTDDPIAVAAMAERLRAARSDARLVWLDGVGHYPMIESPEAFAEAVASSLG